MVHWSLPVRFRKPFLIGASYVFYCSWRWQYGFLLVAVSLFSWAWGRLLARKDGATGWLAAGVAIELLPLMYFKYMNFFLGNLAAVAGAAGIPWHPGALQILLPLGISFFTFQGIAYLVDVAAGEPPFERLRDFLLYKAFWPQLIAGPIIRPDEIREQIVEPRRVAYEDLAEGGRRIVAGLFKKMVLSDTIAPHVDAVFVPNAQPAAMDCFVAVIGFGLQIYWDFSGYSEIAIGSARLFGYRFPENFDWPYLARSPQEFWNRWHISLSRWIRDYVFTPLMFATRRWGKASVLWLLVSMGLCGLWHGAGWTFVAWGVWHGALLLLGETLLKPLFVGTGPGGPARSSLRGLLATLLTLVAVSIGWLLFRARTMEQALHMLGTMVRLEGGRRPAIVRENAVLVIALMAIGLGVAEVLTPHGPRIHGWLAQRPRFGKVVSAACYAVAILAIVVLDQEAQAFVYFQF